MNAPLTAARVTLGQLNAGSRDEFVGPMSSVWEHAPWVAEAVASSRPFADVDALHRAMLAAVEALSPAAKVALLAGHPDLAGADARARTMTADSTREQGGLALAELPAAEATRWDALNAAYRARFGFPFILCVRRHSRASALQTFERRMLNDRETELRIAMQEIGRITRLRLAARIADHGLIDIVGQLTTHVLDTSRGCAAAGVRLELREVGGDGPCGIGAPIAEGVTGVDGQPSTPLVSGEPLRIGRYELRFHVGEYFRRSGVVVSDWPFVDVVPIVFCVDEPEGNYHVPLTITPWAYATYRGQ